MNSTIKPTAPGQEQSPTEALMTAYGVETFGAIDALVRRTVERPKPGPGQVLVKVAAAGVGPWDAWVRSGASTKVSAADLPVTLGSDISGTIVAVGEGVENFRVGEAIFGVTNPNFTGGYAEYAIAHANMIAPMPATLSYQAAASVPVVACTAWQMLFEHGQLEQGQRVLVLGGTGNVGAYAVQLANQFRAYVIATGSPQEEDKLRRLGARHIIDAKTGKGALQCNQVDLVIDTVGGDLQKRALPLVTQGGCFVSAVSEPEKELAASVGIRTRFFIVKVSTAELSLLKAMFDFGQLKPNVGTILTLSEVRIAHEMLDGLIPRRPGKIVLSVDKRVYATEG